MRIRNAQNSDKKNILEFCKNTFSWGDYISDIWKYWIEEKNLFVIEEEIPVGMCHAFFSKNHVWIEGIRINPSFRRKHLASKLVSYVENCAHQKNIVLSHMLIDSKNTPSLSMAKKLGYKILENWNFYSLIPEPNSSNTVKFANTLDKIPLNHYVKSWRWLPLDNEVLTSLKKDKKIIFCDDDDNISLAILTESEHFEKTMIVTFHGGSKKNSLSVLLFLQNFGYENNFDRIQILSRERLPNLKSLENKLSFNLMQKLLD